MHNLFTLATLVALFALPVQAAKLPAHTTKVAKGVYSFGDPAKGYISMFVVTGKGVIAIEPVNTDHATAFRIDAVQITGPVGHIHRAILDGRCRANAAMQIGNPLDDQILCVIGSDDRLVGLVTGVVQVVSRHQPIGRSGPQEPDHEYHGHNEDENVAPVPVHFSVPS